MVTMTNYGRSTRIFRDAAGRTVTLKPGQTRDVNLSEQQQQYYAQIGSHNDRGEFVPKLGIGEPDAVPSEGGGERPRRRR